MPLNTELLERLRYERRLPKGKMLASRYRYGRILSEGNCRLDELDTLAARLNVPVHVLVEG